MAEQAAVGGRLLAAGAEEAALDALIDQSIVFGELSAGVRGDWLARERDPRMVAVLGNSAQAPERKAPAWSAREDELLKRWLPWMSNEQIGARLGRTAVAVELRWKRDLRLTPRTFDPEWPTAREAARLLGMGCAKSIVRLIHEGLLVGRLLPMGRKMWGVSRHALIRFVANPENWIYFKPDHVKDPYLRRLVELRRARWPDAWWTPGQAGAYHGVTHMAINNRINAGTLPAKKWGNWWIKRSDAMAMLIEPGKGHHKLLGRTEAGDAFLLVARGLGFAYQTINALCKWPKGRAEYRLNALLADPATVDAMVTRRGRVQFYAPTGALFADWRDFPNRFPRLEVAHARFVAGRANAGDLAYVRYTLATWMAWYARDEEQRYMAHCLRQTEHNEASLRAAWACLQSWGLEPL